MHSGSSDVCFAALLLVRPDQHRRWRVTLQAGLTPESTPEESAQRRWEIRDPAATREVLRVNLRFLDEDPNLHAQEVAFQLWQREQVRRIPAATLASVEDPSGAIPFTRRGRIRTCCSLCAQGSIRTSRTRAAC